MKKLFALLLALLIAVPAFAEDKEGGTIIIQKSGGGLSTLPTASNQFLGNNGPNPEWETLAGGTGNCAFKRTSPGFYELDCPLYLNTGGAGSGVSIGPTPPTGATAGQLWFDTNDLQTYIYYNDGTSIQWVAISNLPGQFNNSVFSGIVTFPDNSTWTTDSITIDYDTVFTGPDGGTWTSSGITLPASSEFTGGSFDIAGGGTWNSGGMTVPGTTNLTNLNVTGTVNLPNWSITDAMLANGYSGIGMCAAGQYVTGLKRNAPPICGTPTGGAGNWAPLVNPPGGQNNYAPINSPNFTGTVTIGGVPLTNLFASTSNPTFSGTTTITNLNVTGTVALPNGSVTDVMLASAYSGVGACPANQFVNALNRNAAPTCAAPTPFTFPDGTTWDTTGLHAPTGSGKAYAFHDGATWNNVGINNLKALGVGQAVGPDPIDVTDTRTWASGQQANPSLISVTNNNTVSPRTAAGFQGSNGTNSFQIVQTGTQTSGYYCGTLSMVAADGTCFQAMGAGGLDINTDQQIRLTSAGFTSLVITNTGVTANGIIDDVEPPEEGPVLRSANAIQIANGNNWELGGPKCSGVIILNDNTLTGDTCVYVTGGNIATLISQSSGASCQTNSTAPTSGHFSIGYKVSSQIYAIYNNMGQAINFTAMNLCVRNAT